MGITSYPRKIKRSSQISRFVRINEKASALISMFWVSIDFKYFLSFKSVAQSLSSFLAGIFFLSVQV